MAPNESSKTHIVLDIYRTPHDHHNVTENAQRIITGSAADLSSSAATKKEKKVVMTIMKKATWKTITPVNKLTCT